MEENEIKKLLIDFEKTTSQLNDAIEAIVNYTKVANELKTKVSELENVLNTYSKEELINISKNVEKFNSTYKDTSRQLRNTLASKIDGFDDKLEELTKKQLEMATDIKSINSKLKELESTKNMLDKPVKKEVKKVNKVEKTEVM